MEERNLLSVANASTAGCRRAAWRIITSVEQKEHLEADDAKHSPKIVSQDRILQGTVEQILDVLCLRRRNGWRKCRRSYPKAESSSELWSRPLTFWFRMMWRNRQSSPSIFPRTGFNCVSEDRSLKTRQFHSLRRSLRYPSFRRKKRRRRGVNTHVQHVVNAVEVEKSEIIEETVQRMKPTMQEKINQDTKRIEIPPMQFMDKTIDIPVVAQKQVPQVHVVKKTVEDPQFENVQKTVENPPETVSQMQVVEKTTDIPQFRVADKVVDVPVVLFVQASLVQVMVKTVRIPQFRFGEKIAAEIQMVSGTQTSQSLNGEFDAGHDEKSEQERQPHNSSKQPTQRAQERERVKEE